MAAVRRVRLGTEGLGAGDEVFGFAEALGGNADVLVIGQRHALAGGLNQDLGDGFVADRETEDLGRDAGLGGHRDFAFPGLADPAFARDLL